MSYDLQNKTILITGANRGIGKAFVERFVEYGAKKIYAAVRSIDTAAPLVEKYGDKVVPIYVDMEKPDTIAAAAQSATDVEVVINNAGVLKNGGPLDKAVLDNLDYEMNINVKGLIHIAQAFAPVLKANGGGVFANLNSVASLKGFPPFAAYCASKAAAYSITQTLKDVLKEQGTFVLSIHPGPIATDMGHEAGFDEIAEPPTIVADAVIEALKAGEFHAFPDSMAKQVGGAYESFAKNVVESDMQG